jgi:aminopeptidase N
MIIILAVLVAFSMSVSAQVDVGMSAEKRATDVRDASYLSTGNTDSLRAFDVLHYQLEITFPLTSNAFSGTVILTCDSNQDSLDQITLDMSGVLSVTSVTMAQQTPVASHDSTTHSLHLHFDHAVAQDDTFSIRIDYTADAENHGFYSYTMSARTDWAAGWFPCHDLPWDKAAYDLHIRVPVGVEVASIGLLEGREVSGDGLWETFHWKTDLPVATHLVGVMMSSYYTTWSDWYTTTEDDSIEIMYYVFRRDVTEAKDDFIHIIDAMEFYSTLFGPYPFEKYGMAVVEPLYFGGMEYQTMSMINSSWITGIRAAESGMVHELAHQWWGDAVSFDDWPSIWLSEGFAEYAAVMFLEQQYGFELFQAYMAAKRDKYLDQAQTNDYSIYDPYLGDYSHIAIVYKKGAWVLHMLRHMVGDETLNLIFQQYFETYRYRNATIPDFQEVAETVSGMDLDWFFDEWLYDFGYPRIHYSYETTDSAVYGYATNLTLVQVQNNGPVFTMPLDVRLAGGGSYLDTTVWMNAADQTITLYSPFVPETVQLDPMNWILMEKSSGPLAVGQQPDLPRQVILYSNYPNPFNPVSTIRFELPHSSQVSLIVYDILGREVAQLVDGYTEPGYHQTRWDGRDHSGREVPSGVYIARLVTPEYTKSIKMLLLK